MDGSTDTIRVEIIILSSFKDDLNEEIKSLSRFFAITPVESADARGLLKCASKCLATLGVTDLTEQKLSDVAVSPVLVGSGTSVNIGEVNGMKGLVQSNNSWIMWSWCYAHRLELACKNAFLQLIVQVH